MPTTVGIRGVSKGDPTIVLKGDNMTHPDPTQCYRDTNCKDNTCGECDNCDFEEWYGGSDRNNHLINESGVSSGYSRGVPINYINGIRMIFPNMSTSEICRRYHREYFNKLYGAD